MLKKFGMCVPLEALIDGLMGNNWMVRRHAAEALGRSATHVGLEPLIEALKDEDWLVRRNAAESLARLGRPAGYRPAPIARR